jgi:hypothetical protein
MGPGKVFPKCWYRTTTQQYIISQKGTYLDWNLSTDFEITAPNNSTTLQTLFTYYFSAIFLFKNYATF